MPLTRNSTVPCALANKVWSVPIPTLTPGRYTVPRWRIRMLPASTFSPPNFLTPNRFECESRPLRVLPPAFLCAIYLTPAETLSDDRRDLHVGIRLPMSLFALVVLSSAKLDDSHLVTLTMTFDRGNDLGAAHVWSPDGNGGAGAHQQHLIEFDTGALIRIELLDTHHSTFLDAVLFTARGNHGIHGFRLQWAALRVCKRAGNCTAPRPENQTGAGT